MGGGPVQPYIYREIRDNSSKDPQRWPPSPFREDSPDVLDSDKR